MNAIVAVDKNWAIGKEGGLLCHIPGDLKYYKEKTINKTIVMGRKTLESLPNGKPLPSRTNIILSRNNELKEASQIDKIFYVVSSLEEFKAKIIELKIKEEDIYVSGGAEIYRELLQCCTKVYVTKINENFDGDTFFPNLDLDDDFYVSHSEESKVENGIEYTFYIYERNI